MDDFFWLQQSFKKNSSVANARMNIRRKKKMERDLGYMEAFKTSKFIENIIFELNKPAKWNYLIFNLTTPKRPLRL